MKFKKLRDNAFVCYLAMLLGVAICVFSLNFFLVPHSIAPGGFSGIATIVYQASGKRVPVGLTMLVLNLPLFIFAYKRMGRSFAFRTLFGLLLFSLLADVVPVYSLTDEGFLSAIYGGVLMGAGLGLTVWAGGCTGGTDLLAILINSYIRSVSTGVLLFLIDALVVIVSGIMFGLQPALFAVVTVYLTSKLLGFLTDGAFSGTTYFIISAKSEDIKAAITDKMQRGVTEIPTRGGYSGSEYTAILCAVDKRSESIRLRRIVADIDEKAFLMAWNASEVRGEGFSRIDEG